MDFSATLLALSPIQATKGIKYSHRATLLPSEAMKSLKENKEATPRDSINLSRGVASLARAYPLS